MAGHSPPCLDRSRIVSPVMYHAYILYKSPWPPPHTLFYFFPSFASAHPPSAYPPTPETQNSPRLVASSSSVVSTDRAAIRTYRTTDPRMKQFLTAICRGARCQHLLVREEIFQKRAWGVADTKRAPIPDRPLKIIFLSKIQTNN